MVFETDMVEMNGNLRFTPKGGTERVVATPYKKYYKTEDYIYCPTPTNCKIYINNQKMMDLNCRRGSFNLWVIEKQSFAIFQIFQFVEGEGLKIVQ